MSPRLRTVLLALVCGAAPAWGAAGDAFASAAGKAARDTVALTPGAGLTVTGRAPESGQGEWLLTVLDGETATREVRLGFSWRRTDGGRLELGDLRLGKKKVEGTIGFAIEGADQVAQPSGAVDAAALAAAREAARALRLGASAVQARRYAVGDQLELGGEPFVVAAADQRRVLLVSALEHRELGRPLTSYPLRPGEFDEVTLRLDAHGAITGLERLGSGPDPAGAQVVRRLVVTAGR